MPVIVDSITSYHSSVTPSDLNVETTIIEIYGEAKVYIVEGYISLQNWSEGDTFDITIYLAVDGINYQKYISYYVTFASEPVIAFPPITLNPQVRYKVTIKQTNGTVRTIYYSFVKMTLTVV